MYMKSNVDAFREATRSLVVMSCGTAFPTKHNIAPQCKRSQRRRRDGCSCLKSYMSKQVIFEILLCPLLIRRSEGKREIRIPTVQSRLLTKRGQNAILKHRRIPLTNGMFGCNWLHSHLIAPLGALTEGALWQTQYSPEAGRSDSSAPMDWRNAM